MSGHRRAFACLALLCAAGVLALPLDQVKASGGRVRTSCDETGGETRRVAVDRTTRAYGIVEVRSSVWHGRARGPAGGPVPVPSATVRAELLRGSPDLAEELAREPDGWRVAWSELPVRAALGLLLLLVAASWWALLRRSPIDLRARPAHAILSTLGLALVPWLPLSLLLGNLWWLAGTPRASALQLVEPAAALLGTTLLLCAGLVVALRPGAGAEVTE